MIITRKIQIYVAEEDKELKKNYIATVYNWRNLVRKGANMVIAHKFVQDNMREFIYLKEEMTDKFYVKDMIREGKGMSEQNTTYRVLSDMLKGDVPSDILATLNQSLAKTYKETKKDIAMGKASLRSYKNNIPIPFSAKAIRGLQWDTEDKRFYFGLFGIPFAMNLGRDRSFNKPIIERVLAEDYKLCSSSIMIDDTRKRMYLLMCIDIPQQEHKLKEDKIMYADLGIETPIVCECEGKTIEIGSKEEYLYRRLQIQEGLKRLQKACKYNQGSGRKRKTQAVERYKEKESNYVETKLHQYSRALINCAIKAECATIVLRGQKTKEAEAKEEDFLLRNWGYFGLNLKIEYKAKLAGITVKKD